MHSTTHKSFRTMSQRHAQLQAAYAARRTVHDVPLQAWLDHNRHITDHASRSRVLVAHEGRTVRLTRYAT